MNNIVETMLNNLKDSKIKIVDLSEKDVPFHPIATSQPLMSEEDFNALVDNITHNGQLRPVIVYKKKILDGRHRYKACKELGLPMKYVILKGEYNMSVLRELSDALHTNRNLTSVQKQAMAYMYKRDTAKVTYKQASDRYGIAERALKTITSLYNDLAELGYESDFELILTAMFKGHRVESNKFEWSKHYKNRIGSFSMCRKLIKEYREEIEFKSIGQRDELDPTEIGDKIYTNTRRINTSNIEDEKDKIIEQQAKYIKELEVKIEKLEKRLERTLRTIESLTGYDDLL